MSESQLLELIADKIITQNRTKQEARHDGVLTGSQWRERTTPRDDRRRNYEVGASYTLVDDPDEDETLLESLINSGRYWHSNLRYRGDEIPGGED